MKMKAAVMYGPNDIRVEMVDKPCMSEERINTKDYGCWFMRFGHQEYDQRFKKRKKGMVI